VPGDLPVAPLAPLGVAQHQGDGFALVRVGARQAVRAVGENPEEHRIALRSLAHVGRYLCKSGPGRGENAMKTIAQPVILAVREKNDRSRKYSWGCSFAEEKRLWY
jgi:hypothetical protein